MRDAHPLPGADVVVTGADGPLRLQLVTHGQSSGAPVLLVHGLPTSSCLWRDVLHDLERADVFCLAPDLVGLGGSERPVRPRAYALDAQAQALLGLLDEHDIRRVAVVGHDLGGAIAVHLTALAPERVSGLVLVDAPVHADAWPVTPVLPLLVPGAGQLSTWLLRRAPSLARRLLAAAFGPGLSERELDCLLRPLLTADGATGLRRFIRAVDLAPVEAAWRLVATRPPPALVLWGDRDGVLSTAYGRRVAGELAGAAWVPVTDAGHLLPQERPERVAEEIAGFMADLPTQDRSAPRPNQSADQ